MKLVNSGILMATLLTMTGVAYASTDIEIAPGSCSGINAALAAMDENQGGVIRLSAGVYECQEPVLIKIDNVQLLGAGSDKTFLKAANGKAMPVIVIGDIEPVAMDTPKWGIQYYPKRPVKNISLSGVSVDGNRHSTSFEFQKTNECYDFDAKISLDCSVAANRLVRNNGITIRRASNVVVRDVITDRNYSGGLVTEKICDHLSIDGMKSRDNFFDGFAGYETSTSAIRNCQINQNAFSAVSVDLGFEGNLIENCDLSNNGDNGIFSANVGFNTFSNLKIVGNKNFGVYVDGTSRRNADGSWEPLPHTCDGNVVKDSVLTDDGRGIGIAGLCAKTVMTNLKIAVKSTCKFSAVGADVTETNVSCLNP